jgi:hypothetical protein
MGSFDVLLDDERSQLDAFVEHYRSAFALVFSALSWFHKSVLGGWRGRAGRRLR